MKTNLNPFSQEAAKSAEIWLSDCELCGLRVLL